MKVSCPFNNYIRLKDIQEISFKKNRWNKKLFRWEIKQWFNDSKTRKGSYAFKVH